MLQTWQRRFGAGLEQGVGLESPPLSLGQCLAILGDPVIDFNPEELQEYSHSDPPQKPSSTFHSFVNVQHLRGDEEKARTREHLAAFFSLVCSLSKINNSWLPDTKQSQEFCFPICVISLCK